MHTSPAMIPPVQRLAQTGVLDAFNAATAELTMNVEGRTGGAMPSGMDQDTSIGGAALLVIVTSLFFLAPARLALDAGRLWHAAVFASVAVTCVIYHVCDEDLPIALGFEGASCSDSTKNFLTLADHGMAYFAFMQMAFIVIGPEDPVLQWIDNPTVQDTPPSALAMLVPRDVTVLTRALPGVAFVVFLNWFPSWQDFHWHFILLNDVLIIFGSAAFWMHPDRRSSIQKVLIRLRFWKRMCFSFFVPLAASAMLFVLMENSQGRTMHAFWHIALSGLAVVIFQSVSQKGSADTSDAKEVLEVSARNPIVAKVLLGSALLFGAPTLLASLALSRSAEGEFQWPLVTMPTDRRPGGYLVAIGALPTLTALTLAFWLVRSTVGHHAEAQEIVISKQLGCSMGFLGTLLGFLAVVADGSRVPTLHKCCLVASFCTLALAMLLTSLSTRNPWAPGSRPRCLLAFSNLLAVMSFLMLFALDEQFVPNAYKVPRPCVAITEYASVLLSLAWPLTWSDEVQERWQSHKGWRTTRQQAFV